MYIISQCLGIVVTVLAVVSFQMKKKWQIMLLSTVANLINVFVFLLLNGFTSAVMITIIVTLQCGVNALLALKGREASALQKAVFTALFLICGLPLCRKPLDFLPIIASLMFMMSATRKTEQGLRIWSAMNAVVCIVYDVIVGTTAVLGQIISLASILISLYRYRKQKTE